MIVAIDGPAGAGKSTVARAVAEQLGFVYLDTGAMYRCVALARQREPQKDSAELQIGIGDVVVLDGDDVTEAIRSPQVTELASEVAAEPQVREAMAIRQKALLARGDWVAEGRDIGTVIAPQADLKIFLTADPAERARRRAGQTGRDIAEVLSEQQQRDQRDEARELSPLTAADDAVLLDTTGLGSDAVTERVVELARAVQAKGKSQ